MWAVASFYVYNIPYPVGRFKQIFHSVEYKARYLPLPTIRYHDTRSKSSIHQIIRAKRHIAMPEMPILSASPASCPLLELPKSLTYLLIFWWFFKVFDIHFIQIIPFIYRLKRYRYHTGITEYHIWRSFFTWC